MKKLWSLILMAVLTGCSVSIDVVNENAKPLTDLEFTCGDYTWTHPRLEPGDTIEIPMPDDVTGVPKLKAKGNGESEFFEDTKLPYGVEKASGWIKFIWRGHGDFVSNMDLGFHPPCCLGF